MKNKHKVFISYSYDSKEHIIWVTDLASDLQNRFNIDVIFDRWNANYGSFLPKFMNDGIKNAERVIVVCTEKYVEKSNMLGSGVQFEGCIIGKELFKNTYTDKFIPIIRYHTKNKIKAPLSLEGRKYLDFREDASYEDSLKELYREIYRLPKTEFSTNKKVSKQKSNSINRDDFLISCVIFAAGKGTRTKKSISKHLMPIVHNGIIKPMIFHTIDLVLKIGMHPIVLYGFDGTNLKNNIELKYRNKGIKLLRICKDDASDLTFNTGGTLIRFQKEIYKLTENNQHILFTVGDQPYMRLDTIKEFVNYYFKENLDGCILSTNARGNEILEKSSSTRISTVGSEIVFVTPPKEQIFDPNTYSPLLDVGVIVLRKELFRNAVSKLTESEIFGKIINNVPIDKRGIKNIDIFKEYEHSEQFANINYSIDEKKSNIIQDWLEWNIYRKRTKNDFSIFDYPGQYTSIFEIDTTLICNTTPSCGADCTYRFHRSNKTIDVDKAKNIIKQARNTGFGGVLFSGGGENLEPVAYPIFIELLKLSQEIGLTTHLATNGLFFAEKNVDELCNNLHSIRFSINTISKIDDKKIAYNEFSHLGIIADKILLSRKTVDRNSLPTKIIANILLSPETPIIELESSILMLSNIGVDAIRVKPKHLYKDGHWDVDPDLYKHHFNSINELKTNKDYSFPAISFPKLEQLLDVGLQKKLSSKCWYSDFNPIVIGCDCISYSCCEMKYENKFIRSHIDLSQNDFNYIIGDNIEPQNIIPSKCFRGCKGYILNQQLQKLLDDYKNQGSKLLGESNFIYMSKHIIDSISRISMDN